MGFFSNSTRNIKDQVDSIAFGEEYIRRTTRTPSKCQEYENPVFAHHFANNVEDLIDQESVDDGNGTLGMDPPKMVRSRLSFRRLFRRRSKVIDDKSTGFDSNKENITPLVQINTNDENEEDFNNADIFVDSSILEGVNAFQIHQDEEGSSSCQISNFEETHKRHNSIRRIFRGFKRSEVVKNDDSMIILDPTQEQDKPYGLKEVIFGPKIQLIDEDTTNCSSPSILNQRNCVYEAEETLTQRYMSNNYEKLMQDVDSVPFDLSIKEEPTNIQQIITQAVQALSPKKTYQFAEIEKANSIRFRSQQQVDKCLELDGWNPYETAKKVREIDAISLNSGDYELAEKYNIKIGKQRPSRLSTLVRRLSLRRCPRSRSTVDSSFEVKPFNSSLDSVNNIGDDSDTSNRKRQSSKNREASYEKFPYDLFDASTVRKNNTDFNIINSSETVVANSSTFKSLFPNHNGKPFIAATDQNFSGSTHVENSGNEQGSNDTDSFLSTVRNSTMKEQVGCGNDSHYQQIIANPCQFSVNNENIHKDILNQEFGSKEKTLQTNKPDDVNSQQPEPKAKQTTQDNRLKTDNIELNKFNKITRSNSVGSLRTGNPLSRNQTVIDIPSRPKTCQTDTPKTPHTSKHAPMEEESYIPYNRNLLTPNQSLYSDNPRYTWSFSDLEIESEQEDDYTEKQKEMDVLKGLVKKNKIRHNEELKRPYSGLY